MSFEPHDDAQLDSLIDRFLEDHRESLCGGWAEITPDDVQLLYEIVQRLVELKCDKDADGDYPIQTKIINRRVYERLQCMPLPYAEQKDGERVPFLERLSILVSNVHAATERLDTEVRCERAHPS